MLETQLVIRSPRARGLWAAVLLVLAPVLATAAGERTGQGPPAPVPAAADSQWRLPVAVPMPPDNVSTAARVELGKALFFDPRLSGNGATSCATCHNPSLGWSDGQKTALGAGGAILNRATPSIVNTAYNTQFMWDGSKKSLEDQALGPMKTPEEMNTDFPALLAWLRSMEGYAAMFRKAYPQEEISEQTIAKALAAFQRSLVSRDSPFDRWIAGDAGAMTPSQRRGFKIFNDPDKGNCAACHSAPNFTDNGFHNIGIKPAGLADAGRFNVRKVAAMKGAFKTPSLRDIELTAPYFRNGSASTLRDVVEHYAKGGEDLSNISPDMKRLTLSEQDKADLVAFMKALTGRRTAFAVPELPR